MAIDIRSEIEQRLEEELPLETVAHVHRTAAVARELAAIHGVDPDRAELAALLHDIADGYSDTELLILAERYGLPVGLTEARVPKLLHAAVGAEILRREWEITDEELLDAVRDHITGGPRMSKLAKIVFIADKLEPERDRHYGGLKGLRERARVDLDDAMLGLYAWRMSDMIATQRPIHERMTTSRNLLLENVRAGVLGR